MLWDLPSGKKLQVLTMKNLRYLLLIPFAIIKGCIEDPKSRARVYSVGDTQETWDDKGNDGAVTLEEASFERIEDSDNGYITLKYSFDLHELTDKLETTDVCVYYSYYSTTSEDGLGPRYYNDKAQCVDINGYDIFETNLTGEIEYTFFFEIPHAEYYDADYIQQCISSHTEKGIHCQFFDLQFKCDNTKIEIRSSASEQISYSKLPQSFLPRFHDNGTDILFFRLSFSASVFACIG